MNNNLYISVAKSYTEILPQNQEALLLLVYLYQKTQNGTIQHEFTKRDFDDTLDDVLDLLGNPKVLQKELLSRKISNYYYRTIPYKNEYRMHLTIFAENLCKLVVSQLEPQMKRLALIHTFKKTLALTDEYLENIDTFKLWYDHNFIPAKNEILSHIEILQKNIEDRIGELRQLLKPNVENPKELINNFIDIFDALEKQTAGILNTIDFKDETWQKIQSVRDEFSETEDSLETYIQIQRAFENFFSNIDRRILSINERIQLASKRLRNLLDTLKHKQQFKVNIERLLHYMLKTAKHEKGQILLHEDIPTRALPFLQTKFLAVPLIDFQVQNDALPNLPEQDPEHAERERQKNLQMLKNQEQTALWMSKIERALKSEKDIEYTEWFNKIAKIEGNLEVPIKVCFGLIETCNNSETKHIKLQQSFQKTKDKNLTLWKMTIHHTDS